MVFSKHNLSLKWLGMAGLLSLLSMVAGAQVVISFGLGYGLVWCCSWLAWQCLRRFQLARTPLLALLRVLQMELIKIALIALCLWAVFLWYPSLVAWSLVTGLMAGVLGWLWQLNHQLLLVYKS